MELFCLVNFAELYLLDPIGDRHDIIQRLVEFHARQQPGFIPPPPPPQQQNDAAAAALAHQQ